MGSAWATAANVIVAPGNALRRVREHPSFLFPLVLVLVPTSGVAFAYYSFVDVAWLFETQLQDALPDQQPPAALESGVTRNIMRIGAAAGAAFVLVLTVTVWAAYLAFVSMITNDGHGFGIWFALVSWCSLPAVLAQLATVVNLIVSDVSRLPPEQLNPLSVANLLGIDGGSSGLVQFVTNQDPTTLWSLVLVVLGYHMWTQRSLPAAAAVVLAPCIVIGAIALLVS